MHQIVDCQAEGDILRVRFNEGEVLSVFAPRNASGDDNTFRIDDADRVRWEWFYYGRTKTPENQYFEEFTVASVAEATIVFVWLIQAS